MPVALDNILEQIQTLHYEISTESRLVRVGLKDEQNLEAIINRYPLLTNRETAYGLKQAADAGVRLIHAQPFEGAGGKLVAFLHPKSTRGVLTELCAVKPGATAAH